MACNGSSVLINILSLFYQQTQLIQLNMLSSSHSWLFNPQWIAIHIEMLIPLAFDSFISLCICQQPIFRICKYSPHFPQLHRFLPNKIRNVHSLWWRVERMPLMYYFVHWNCTYCIHPTWKLKLSAGAKWQLNPSRSQAVWMHSDNIVEMK